MKDIRNQNIKTIKLYGSIYLFIKMWAATLQKSSLNALHKHFPEAAKVYKVFDNANVKTRSPYLGNMKSIINSHKEWLTTQKAVTTPICNFRSRKECLLEDQCEVGHIKYIASTSVEDEKVQSKSNRLWTNNKYRQQHRQNVFGHKKKYWNTIIKELYLKMEGTSFSYIQKILTFCS